jgi:hypothetical protein
LAIISLLSNNAKIVFLIFVVSHIGTI